MKESANLKIMSIETVWSNQKEEMNRASATRGTQGSKPTFAYGSPKRRGERKTHKEGGRNG